MSDTEVLQMLHAPFLKLSLGIRVMAFFGIFVLVTLKPDVWAAIGLVVISLSLAFLLSLSPRRIESTPGRSA